MDENVSICFSQNFLILYLIQFNVEMYNLFLFWGGIGVFISLFTTSIVVLYQTALLAISLQMNINIYFCVNVFSPFRLSKRESCSIVIIFKSFFFFFTFCCFMLFFKKNKKL